MTTTFNSPIFGETRHATDEEKAAIQRAVEETPVAVFQALNKHMNARGLLIGIGDLDESRAEKH